MRSPVPLRASVLRLPEYQAPPEGRAGCLRLNFNENTVGCSPIVRAALARITRQQVAMYPEYEATRRRLARFFRVAPQELLLTNGADDALRLVSDAFLEPGRRALLVEPTFPMYAFYAGLAGARILRLRYDSQMRFPQEAALKALKRAPQVFFLANPNNPTGTQLTRAQVRAVLQVARRTIVVVDEAYWEFSGVTVLPWIRDFPNLMVIRTFSKAAGLAGLRLGCVLANRQLIRLIRKVQPPFAVNTAALVAADAAVRDAAYVHGYAREVRAARRLLSASLARLGIPAFPSGANFLLLDFGKKTEALLRAFSRQGILLRERHGNFERRGYVRVTVGTVAQTRKFIAALEELW
jgi:histidinol-phosphate aminotransferase